MLLAVCTFTGVQVYGVEKLSDGPAENSWPPALVTPKTANRRGCPLVTPVYADQVRVLPPKFCTLNPVLKVTAITPPLHKTTRK
jgi:hypothetical protein